jgi:hypothetical protein
MGIIRSWIKNNDEFRMMNDDCRFVFSLIAPKQWVEEYHFFNPLLY